MCSGPKLIRWALEIAGELFNHPDVALFRGRRVVATRRWMIGLTGRRVPIALAVVPASLVSVLLVVGGIVIWSGLNQMVARAASVPGAAGDTGIIGQIIFVLGPTLLFPVWGVALAVATLGYYYRRRGPCGVCGRGASGEIGRPSSTYQRR